MPSFVALVTELASDGIPAGRFTTLLTLITLLTISIMAIPIMAVFNLEAYYQGLLLIIAPLVIVSLCLAVFSMYLTLSLLRITASLKRPTIESHIEGSPLNPLQNPSTVDNGIAPSGDSASTLHQPTEADRALFHIGALQAADEHDLTKREIEVLELLLQGRNAERISQILVISKHTAKSHIYNTYRKIGVSSQQELLDMFQRKTLKSEEDIHARAATRHVSPS